MEIVANSISKEDTLSSTDTSSIDNIKFSEDDIELVEFSDKNLEVVEKSKEDIIVKRKPNQRSRVYARSSNPEVNESNIKCVSSTEESHTAIPEILEGYREDMEICKALITFPEVIADKSKSVKVTEGLFKILKLIARPAIILFKRLDYFSVIFTLFCVVLVFILEFLRVTHMI